MLGQSRSSGVVEEWLCCPASYSECTGSNIKHGVPAGFLVSHPIHVILFSEDLHFIIGQ